MIIVISIFTLLAFMTLITSKKYENINLIIFVILLFVFQLLYQTLGNDYWIYEDFYKSVENIFDIIQGQNIVFINHVSNFEIGYKILNSFFKTFTNNINIMLITVNGFLLYMFFSFLKKNNINSGFIILPFYSFIYISLQMVMIRHAIATIIFWTSIHYIIEKKLIKFIICILLASMFHRSALILLPLYYIVNKKCKVKTYIIIFSIVFTIYILKIDIVSNLLITIINSLPEGFKILSNKASYYINHSIDSNYLGIGFFENLFSFCALIYIRIQLETKKNYTKFDNIAFNLSAGDIIMQFLFFNQTHLLLRISYYFSIFKFLLIGAFLSKIKRKEDKIIIICLLIIYCFFMMYLKTNYIRVAI